MFSQHVPEHDQGRENEQQNVPESHSVHAHDNQSIYYSSCKEHDGVNQCYISRMIHFQPIIDRPVSFRLGDCVSQFNLSFCPSLKVFQLIVLLARFALSNFLWQRSNISNFVRRFRSVWRQFSCGEFGVVRLSGQHNVSVVLAPLVQLLIRNNLYLDRIVVVLIRNIRSFYFLRILIFFISPMISYWV